MLPDDFFSDSNMRKWMIASVLVSFAIGLLIYNLTQDLVLSAAVGGFLALTDHVALHWLKNRQDKD